MPAKLTKDRGMTAACAVALLTLVACNSTEYVGNSAKGFWSDESSAVTPNQAYAKAQPHLEATWKARCEQVRNHDEYCEQMPLDHVVRRGKYFYVTRTSYPYKEITQYTRYAVRVHAETGEVTPLSAAKSL